MAQVRIIFASLFPALWVVTAGQGLAQMPTGPLAVRLGHSISARQPGKGIPWGASREFAQVSQNYGRRLGTQSGPGGCTFAATAAVADFAVVAQSPVFAGQNRLVSVLSRPWHFLCRAAAEPRAPSSVT